MAHELIRSIPSEMLEKLDLMLSKNTSAVECAQWLHSMGLCQKVPAPSLARAVRRYKLDTLTVHEAARAEAVKNAPPGLRKRIDEQITAYEQLGAMQKIVQARDKAFWAAVEKTPPAIAAMSDTLRKSAESAFAMRERITRLAMDAGIIRKAPTELHITADMVVVRDERDAGQLLEAIAAFIARNREVHEYLPEALASTRKMLESPKPKPRLAPKPITELDEQAQQVWANVQQQLAEARAEKAALGDPETTVPVEDVGPVVPLRFDEIETEVVEIREPEAELLPRGEQERRRDSERDWMPDLEQVW